MKIAAVSAPRFEWVVSKTRLSDFVTLMKPRVMILAVFTAFVGMAIAPGHLDPLFGSIAILAIAIGAGAAGVLNMWYDADIDALMRRTAMRPSPRGAVSRREALVFGLALAAAAVVGPPREPSRGGHILSSALPGRFTSASSTSASHSSSTRAHRPCVA